MTMVVLRRMVTSLSKAPWTSASESASSAAEVVSSSSRMAGSCTGLGLLPMSLLLSSSSHQKPFDLELHPAPLFSAFGTTRFLIT